MTIECVKGEHGDCRAEDEIDCDCDCHDWE
jgi:hypothetical protein